MFSQSSSIAKNGIFVLDCNMTPRNERLPDYRFDNMGLSVFSGSPDPQQKHRHNEVEMAVFEHEPIVSLYGGQQVTIAPNRLVVFWGAMPHQALKVGRATIGYGIRVPLALALRWNLPEPFIRRLMGLDVFIDPTRATPSADLALVKNWVSLMRRKDSAGSAIVLLEVEARLRRLAMDTVRGASGTAQPMAAGKLDRFGQIVELVAKRYTEPLSIPNIARTVGVHRNHVMRIFRKMTGMSLLEYITHHRVCHAQRLLAMTDMKVVDIAYDSGFVSPTRFYAVFQRSVGVSPGRYRRGLK
jgi:AraC-like DNA-binding protein